MTRSREERLAASDSPASRAGRRTARPDDPNKYFMVSADCHVTESLDFLERVDAAVPRPHPHMEVRADGAQYLITEGNRPQLVKSGRTGATVQEQQTFERPEDNRASKSRMEEEDLLRLAGGRTVEQRLVDQARTASTWRSCSRRRACCAGRRPIPVFAMAMCRAWNRWALDQIGAHMQGDRPEDPADGADRHRRPGGRHAGDRVGGRARVPRRVPRQLADLRARPSSASFSTTTRRSSRCGRCSRRPGSSSPSTCRRARTPARRAATAAPSSTTSATRWRRPSSRSCS